MIDDNRTDKFEKIDKKSLINFLDSGAEFTIQFVSPNKYNAKIFEEINELSKVYTDNLIIRFYGHYSSIFNCENLMKIPNVRNLDIDCLDSVKNIKSLSKLENLRKLTLGIYNLEDTNLLAYENLLHLKKLALTETKTTSLDLIHLQKFQKLKWLYIDGHHKNISSISQIEPLEDLLFRGIKNTNFSFLNENLNLKALNILMGGRADINEIQNSNIEEIKIDSVRGFNDISGILNLRNLKKLTLSTLKQLQKIKIENINNKLQELRIMSCKDLHSVQGLNKLLQLNCLSISESVILFEDLMKHPLPKNLNEFQYYTFKDKQDKAIRNIIKSMGYISRDIYGNID